MIGKTIKAILVADAPLMVLVPATKVFPYVVNENTTMPAIVYTIDSITPIYNKGGWANDVIYFSIYSSAKSYEELQPIISAIRTAVEFKNVGAGTQSINRIYLDSFDEDALPDWIGFYNKLTFKVTINTY
jgi:hypothetical protein